jgi:hypothetical protein
MKERKKPEEGRILGKIPRSVVRVYTTHCPAWLIKHAVNVISQISERDSTTDPN